MKKIVYNQADGTAAVVTPAEGSRLAISVTIDRKKMVSKEPIPVDRFLRRWPVEGAVAEWAETEDEWMARIAAKDVPAGVPFEIVDASEIPADRTFRNAWKCGAGKIEHDMAKCREIQKNRLRELRAPKLAALDVEFMRALEAGDTAKCAEIAAQKQALRDVTKDPAIAVAKTVEELKAAVPAVLRDSVEVVRA
jgi:hypothetical protein